MSDIHLIITKGKIPFLPKERYLKFVEFNNINGFFLYTRLCYDKNMILSHDNQKYKLSKDGKTLIDNAFSISGELYWTTANLTNNIGEEKACEKYLKYIKNRDYIEANTGESLIYNTLYKIKNI